MPCNAVPVTLCRARPPLHGHGPFPPPSLISLACMPGAPVAGTPAPSAMRRPAAPPPATSSLGSEARARAAPRQPCRWEGSARGSLLVRGAGTVGCVEQVEGRRPLMQVWPGFVAAPGYSTWASDAALARPSFFCMACLWTHLQPLRYALLMQARRRSSHRRPSSSSSKCRPPRPRRRREILGSPRPPPGAAPRSSPHTSLSVMAAPPHGRPPRCRPSRLPGQRATSSWGCRPARRVPRSSQCAGPSRRMVAATSMAASARTTRCGPLEDPPGHISCTVGACAAHGAASRQPGRGSQHLHGAPPDACSQPSAASVSLLPAHAASPPGHQRRSFRRSVPSQDELKERETDWIARQDAAEAEQATEDAGYWQVGLSARGAGRRASGRRAAYAGALAAALRFVPAHAASALATTLA